MARDVLNKSKLSDEQHEVMFSVLNPGTQKRKLIDFVWMRITLMLVLVNVISIYCVDIYYLNSHYPQTFYLEALVGMWVVTYFGSLYIWPKGMIDEFKRVF